MVLTRTGTYVADGVLNGMIHAVERGEIETPHGERHKFTSSVKNLKVYPGMLHHDGSPLHHHHEHIHSFHQEEGGALVSDSDSASWVSERSSRGSGYNQKLINQGIARKDSRGHAYPVSPTREARQSRRDSRRGSRRASRGSVRSESMASWRSQRSEHSEHSERSRPSTVASDRSIRSQSRKAALNQRAPGSAAGGSKATAKVPVYRSLTEAPREQRAAYLRSTDPDAPRPAVQQQPPREETGPTPAGAYAGALGGTYAPKPELNEFGRPGFADPKIRAATDVDPGRHAQERQRRMRGIIWPKPAGGKDYYVSSPKTKTRTQLFDDRRRDKLPDMSFDVDGDGFVSQQDFYMSNQFDDNNDKVLQEDEQHELRKKLVTDTVHNYMKLPHKIKERTVVPMIEEFTQDLDQAVTDPKFNSRLQQLANASAVSNTYNSTKVHHAIQPHPNLAKPKGSAFHSDAHNYGLRESERLTTPDFSLDTHRCAPANTSSVYVQQRTS